jgi:hypothetical protein
LEWFIILLFICIKLLLELEFLVLFVYNWLLNKDNIGESWGGWLLFEEFPGFFTFKFSTKNN